MIALRTVFIIAITAVSNIAIADILLLDGIGHFKEMFNETNPINEILVARVVDCEAPKSGQSINTVIKCYLEKDHVEINLTLTSEEIKKITDTTKKSSNVSQSHDVYCKVTQFSDKSVSCVTIRESRKRFKK